MHTSEVCTYAHQRSAHTQLRCAWPWCISIIKCTFRCSSWDVHAHEEAPSSTLHALHAFWSSCRFIMIINVSSSFYADAAAQMCMTMLQHHHWNNMHCMLSDRAAGSGNIGKVTHLSAVLDLSNLVPLCVWQVHWCKACTLHILLFVYVVTVCFAKFWVYVNRGFI